MNIVVPGNYILFVDDVTNLRIISVLNLWMERQPFYLHYANSDEERKKEGSAFDIGEDLTIYWYVYIALLHIVNDPLSIYTLCFIMGVPLARKSITFEDRYLF